MRIGLLLVIIGAAAGAFLEFFFFAPVIWGFITCAAPAWGYFSLSYSLFHVGGMYYNGRFLWFTANATGCDQGAPP
jgi:hypothetical protein